MAFRRPPPEPVNTRLEALRESLERAEQEVRRHCDGECPHGHLRSKNPPPCDHVWPEMCEVARRKVEWIRIAVAEEEAWQRRGAST